MSKTVYLVASHTNPGQVIRLVNTLIRGSSTSEVVIHHDYSSSYLDPGVFINMSNVHLMDKHIPAYWGGFPLVTLVLNIIEWISTHLEFDWLVFISGQDYPVQPLNEVESFLRNTSYDGFVSGTSLEKAMPCGSIECSITRNVGKRCSDCIGRYYYQYYKMPPVVIKILRKTTQLFGSTQSLFRIRAVPSSRGLKERVGIRALGSPLKGSLKCYKGSQWFTINRYCVERIRQFVNQNPSFSKYYQRTIIPDESFFHTILFNDPSLNILNNNKRFISWSESNQSHSPKVLGSKDLDDIANCDQHFARKFDINVDAEVLDLIDKYILFK